MSAPSHGALLMSIINGVVINRKIRGRDPLLKFIPAFFNFALCKSA